MKTTLNLTVTTALAIALVCPLNATFGQSFKFNSAALKTARSTSTKSRNTKSLARPAPSKSRAPSKTYTKPGKTVATPGSSRRPGNKVTGPTFQPIRFDIPSKTSRLTSPTPNRSATKPLAGAKKPPRKTYAPIKYPIKTPPVKNYAPIKFPIKNPKVTLPPPQRSVPKPLPGVKIPPIKLTPPVKSPVTLPGAGRRPLDPMGNSRRPDPRTPKIDPRLVKELERIRENRGPVLDPERIRDISDALGNRNGNANAGGNAEADPPAAEEHAPNADPNPQPEGADPAPPQDNGQHHANCPHGCHGHCNHFGPGFGLDFPRWGFSYGPNGLYIRGGGRRYVERPGDVIVIEEASPIQAAPGVEIREVDNLPKVYVATTIALSSEAALGNDAGQVILDINGISLPTTLQAWTNESATCSLPMMGLDQPREARLIMVTAQGEVAHSIAVLLMPAKAPAEAPLD